jgi:hypothetical protein
MGPIFSVSPYQIGRGQVKISDKTNLDQNLRFLVQEGSKWAKKFFSKKLQYDPNFTKFISKAKNNVSNVIQVDFK